MSFINGFLVEINQFPRFEDLYTIKDYFFYDSNTKEYGYRDTVIPKEQIINNELMTEEILANLINNKIPVMKRIIDINKQEETWVFNLKEEQKCQLSM